MSAEQQTRTDAQAKAIGTGLAFFRVSAVVAGLAMFVLILEMVLKYGFDNGALDWWPQPHGLLFVLYVAAVANLGFKMRWGLGRMVGVMLAGVVPFLSFVVEARVRRQVEARLSAIEGSPAAH